VTDFSEWGSLESRMEWQIVSCDTSLCFAFVPDVREEICVILFYEHVSRQEIIGKTKNRLVSAQ
jgi:hypothetical protein